MEFHVMGSRLQVLSMYKKVKSWSDEKTIDIKFKNTSILITLKDEKLPYINFIELNIFDVTHVSELICLIQDYEWYMYSTTRYAIDYMKEGIALSPRHKPLLEFLSIFDDCKVPSEVNY